MTEVVVGADIGGTSTRVGVSDLHGTVLSVAIGGPGNPNVVGLDGSAEEIRSVTARALREAQEPHQVVALVLGLAGGSRAASAPGFLGAAVPAGLGVPATLVSDISVAFSSATAAPHGYALVAGTGAVAAEVLDGQLVQQRDGWGWLLGDQGSGFWIGRAAVRATLSALQARRQLSPLHRAVLELAGTTDYLELLQGCYAGPPAQLARFSPLVSEHAVHDDEAAGIVAAAVELLAELVLGLGLHREAPLVLAGSVLTKPGPVGAQLRSRLSGSTPSPLLNSTSGVIGALWIGLRSRGRPAPVHERLLVSARRWV